MKGRKLRRLRGVTVALIGFSSTALVLWVPSADAQETSIEISLRTIVKAPEGSQEVLSTEQVPPELVREMCSVRAESDNNSSVHPGNNLVVESNGDEVVLADVEREPNAMTVAEGTLTLGEQVTVTLVMGPDELFSAGLTVRIVCVEEEPTTTTSEATTTTTEEPTTTTVGEDQEDTTTTTQVLGTTLTTSTTSPPTTDEDTTTTSEVAGTDSTLPFTGNGGGGAAAAALVTLVVGIGLVRIARPDHAHTFGTR